MIRYNGMEVIKIPLYEKVQARKHKQKRINKKWLKRYGMKLIQTRLKSNDIYVAFGKICVPEEIWEVFIKSAKGVLDADTKL